MVVVVVVVAAAVLGLFVRISLALGRSSGSAAADAMVSALVLGAVAISSGVVVSSGSSCHFGKNLIGW